MSGCLPPATLVVCLWKVPGCRLSHKGLFNHNPPSTAEMAQQKLTVSLEVLGCLKKNQAHLPVSLAVVNQCKMVRG